MTDQTIPNTTEAVLSSGQLEHLLCPFCGSVPRYLEHKAGFYTARVICDSCGFHLPPDAWALRSNTKLKDGND
jgi:predicted RNA-binding Zn-ribbon protein involved in translation (DUF1610 family)